MRSKLYRGRDGGQRIWLQPADIENMMEDQLRKAGLMPTEERPVVDVEAFIERHLKARLDQHADLEADVLGLTEFATGRAPAVAINRDLTGAVDDDDSDIGVVGRWRATLAHEATHVHVHGVLFALDEGQVGLFDSGSSREPQRLMRCMKRNVLYRGGGSDWREVQANLGMAALMMPQGLFRTLAKREMVRLGIETGDMMVGGAGARTLALELAQIVRVSRQAAGIRIETLGIARPAGQAALLADG